MLEELKQGRFELNVSDGIIKYLSPILLQFALYNFFPTVIPVDTSLTSYISCYLILEFSGYYKNLKFLTFTPTK